jgi:hypothetical protein
MKYDTLEIHDAIFSLKKARASLRNAGSNKSAGYVTRAIKSAEGALRHATGMRFGGACSKEKRKTLAGVHK